jgi:hypothetical protein
MGLSSDQKKALDEQLDEMFESKVKSFEVKKSIDNSFAQVAVIPEKHRRIFSTVHSWNTSFGQRFYEKIAATIALSSGKDAHTQWQSPIEISEDRVAKIDQIVVDIGKYLKTKGKEGKAPNVDNEIKEILEIPNKNIVEDRNDNIIDVYFDKKYLFDIKTVGPNKDNWISFKKKTLKWSARMDKRVYGTIVIPYNPKAPKPYSAIGFEYMQVGKDILVAEDFWDLIGGKGCYDDIFTAFKKVGNKYFYKTLEMAGVK